MLCVREARSLWPVAFRQEFEPLFNDISGSVIFFSMPFIANPALQSVSLVKV